MTRKDEIANEYFEWMYDFVCDRSYPKELSYRKLLMMLHGIEFTYTIPKDKNRAMDGMELRYRFALAKGYEKVIPHSYIYYEDEYVAKCLDGPCSVFEMMLALAIRCEKDIMDNPIFGNRISQWFWGMISNLGLSGMTDAHFDREYVNDVIKKFLARDYEPDGKGGLFRVRHCSEDLRKVEIWWQLCWYLDSIS